MTRTKIEPGCIIVHTGVILPVAHKHIFVYLKRRRGEHLVGFSGMHA